ncbi:Electrogenic sodium bicarbonate cotransporter 4 [Bagarius yarrelli]|uniref:Anion exchange protein n=1 Tax=Bagarius yarrelli TaxID=175774 RepID=A0A556U355_BAGYA|nr:Electrogenic sodium bicarbonate cotransporter 4 [Bagarius yarrelli]
MRLSVRRGFILLLCLFGVYASVKALYHTLICQSENPHSKGASVIVRGSNQTLYSYNQNSNVVFVGGVPRSGTTLMRAMLDAHPDIRCGEETRVIPRLLALHYGWRRSKEARWALDEEEITQEMLDSATAAFILEIIARHGEPAPLLCNKDPFTLKSSIYLSQLFPNSKFLLMIRDGRASVHSMISRQVTIAGFNISSYRDCLSKWSQAIEIMLFQCTLVGSSRCLTVRYENLVLQPRTTMARVLEFLSVPWHEGVLHHEEAIGQPGGVSLSRVERSTDQVIKPVNLEALSRWVGHIPVDVLKDMSDIAPMLNKLGYDPTANPPDYGQPDPEVIHNTERCKIAIGFLVVGLLAVVFGAVLVFVGPVVIKEQIIKNVEINPRNSLSYTMWKDIPVPFFMSVYFFNVLNPEEILAGEKPTVEQRGPYVYREKRWKDNITFHDNKTVSYREYRQYFFEESMSVGNESDVVTIPNMLVLGASVMMEYLPVPVRRMISATFFSFKEEAFVTKTVGELMWGYDSKLVKYWKSEACNMINGTAGQMWPPFMTSESTLPFYSPDACRSMELVYKRPGTSRGIPVYRFVAPKTLFANGSDYPPNEGFCPCRQSGLLDVRTCRHNSPVFISHPHFYNADPALLQTVNGLDPNENDHGLFIDIHPSGYIDGPPLTMFRTNLVILPMVMEYTQYILIGFGLCFVVGAMALQLSRKGGSKDLNHELTGNKKPIVKENQFVYIGVPVSKGYRKKQRQHRHTSCHDNGSYERHCHKCHGQAEECDRYNDAHDTNEQLSDVDSKMSPAAERLRCLLGEEDDSTPTLFTEMDTLHQEGGELEWKESARWVKFEEKVEERGERWSKPHVSTLSLHSLFELRTCLQSGSILLDLEGYSLPQIVDEIVDKHVQDGLIDFNLKDKISFILLRKHRHQTKKPIHRSLADIGKPSQSSKDPNHSHSAMYHSTEDLQGHQSGSLRKLNHVQSHSMNDISITPSSDQLKNKFMKKIPRDAEASNVLIGEVDFLDKPFVAFVRLAQATTLGGLTEVPIPTRFLFILIGPHGKVKSYTEVGRAIATLMVDDLFSSVAYKAKHREDLIAGLDEFLNEVTVLPPGEWDPKIRIEPPKKVPSAEMRKSVFSLNELGQVNGTTGGGGTDDDNEEMPVPHELGEELAFTGRFCGGLWLDLKRKLPWLLSDFYDSFHIQSISAVLFIYLGCITNAITFGGLLGDATDNYQGVMESFLGTALAGTVFCFFGGQPLIILSSTGPILVFEKLLYEFCKTYDIDYMELRLWIGLHSCFQCLILVASDASYIIKYITRFTEEGFSSLISFIFISDAIKKMLGAFQYYPINMNFKPDYITTYKCDCLPPDQGASMDFNSSAVIGPDNFTDYSLYNFTVLDWSQLSKYECLKYGGSLVGKSCKHVPDLALMSFILFFGTYSMTISLKKFKSSRYFPTKWRTLIADFAIIISIMVFCALDHLISLETPKLHVPTDIKLRKLISDFAIFTSIMTFVGLDILMGLETPKLIVPTELKPTRSDRGWVVMPLGKNPWWMYLASFVPALLVTILIFMDQQITAVIVNRKENKLKKKGCGYHLDMFLVGILMAVCSFLCLPWYVAATVISIAHIESLKMESECSAPGEQPQFLGVREQRLTGILVFVLTGVSVFLAPILQFWERIKLILMPAKHQPDFVYLRHVPLRRVHLFTLVQITCLAVLWILKSTVAAIIFPVMILGLMVVRKMLDFVFSQHDLAWLDDILPEKDKKKKDDEKKKNKDKKKVKRRDRDSDEEFKSPTDSLTSVEMEPSEGLSPSPHTPS